MYEVCYRHVRDRCGNPGLRCDAVSVAGLRRTSRSGQRRGGWGGGREIVRRAGLELLIVSALATLSVLLGVTLIDTTAATSTPLLASTIINVFAPTPLAVHDQAANPLASTGGRGDAARSDAMAVALGTMGVTAPPRLDDRSGPGTLTADAARAIAEAFAAGAESAGSGVHGGSVSSGGSGGLAILLALSMLPDHRLPRRIWINYLCRMTWIFSRPLVRPG
jgi:hypothetical protein